MPATEEEAHLAALLGVDVTAVDENWLQVVRQAALAATANAKAVDAALRVAQNKPSAVIAMSKDIPQPQEPVLDYVTELDLRAELLREYCRGSWEKASEKPNATVAAFFMVAPLSILQTEMEQARAAGLEPIFRTIGNRAAETIRLFLARGGKAKPVPGSEASTPPVTPTRKRPASGTISDPPTVSPLKRQATAGHLRSHSDTQVQQLHSSKATTVSSLDDRDEEPSIPLPKSPASASALSSSPAPSTRSRSAVYRTRERDSDKCIFMGTCDHEVVHIFPNSLAKLDASPLADILYMFWAKDESNLVIRQFLALSVTESPKNLLCMNHQLHCWWGRARFALKPLWKSDKEVVVQFHWLKQSPFKPKDPIGNGEGFIEAVRDQAWGSSMVFRESGIPLDTGQTFAITANKPEDLPSFELLKLQWDLLRVAAISGAGEASDEDYCNDSDDECSQYQSMTQLEEDPFKEDVEFWVFNNSLRTENPESS